jgi:hypothetical protein
MRQIAVIGLLLHYGATVAMNTQNSAPDLDQEVVAPDGVRLFDLHDPALSISFANFLATTPMLNDRLLSAALQSRLARMVGTYRSLTPAEQPAFFVATHFDLLTDGLLADNGPGETQVLPMQVCPVFASGAAAPVEALLAAASGLPDALFVNAPGRQDRYRYLFLQTEFSHCRFFAGLGLGREAVARAPLTHGAERGKRRIAFTVDGQGYMAAVDSRDQFRAIVETVGDVEAIRAFRAKWPGNDVPDEVDVLRYLRLLSLLATDGRNGYGAIPVLRPVFSTPAEAGPDPLSVPVAESLDLAYRLRARFRKLVSFPLRDIDDLRRANQLVSRALENPEPVELMDSRIANLLEQFVTGTDILLAADPPTRKSTADSLPTVPLAWIN